MIETGLPYPSPSSLRSDITSSPTWCQEKRSYPPPIFSKNKLKKSITVDYKYLVKINKYKSLFISVCVGVCFWQAVTLLLFKMDFLYSSMPTLIYTCWVLFFFKEMQMQIWLKFNAAVLFSQIMPQFTVMKIDVLQSNHSILTKGKGWSYRAQKWRRLIGCEALTTDCP